MEVCIYVQRFLYAYNISCHAQVQTRWWCAYAGRADFRKRCQMLCAILRSLVPSRDNTYCTAIRAFLGLAVSWIVPRTRPLTSLLANRVFSRSLTMLRLKCSSGKCRSHRCIVHLRCTRCIKWYHASIAYYVSTRFFVCFLFRLWLSYTA